MYVIGTGEGNLWNPEAIAISPSGNLLVCDTGNDRVVSIDPKSGRQIQVFGTQNNYTELQMPMGIAVFNKKIVVADSGNNRVKVYDYVTGSKLVEFGSMGNGRGEFRSPEAVTCTNDGLIVVGDSGNGRIQAFDFDGKLQGATATKFEWISGLSVTPDNKVVVSDCKSKNLQIF